MSLQIKLSNLKMTKQRGKHVKSIVTALNHSKGVTHNMMLTFRVMRI
jgi:hypothetical protein